MAVAERLVRLVAAEQEKLASAIEVCAAASRAPLEALPGALADVAIGGACGLPARQGKA